MRTATVLTHRRPSETRPAIDALVEIARAAGATRVRRPGGDAQAPARARARARGRRRRPARRRHLLRARGRRHDPHRAAQVRRDRRPRVRGQLRRDRVPRDRRPRRGADRVSSGRSAASSRCCRCRRSRCRGGERRMARDQRRLDAPPARQPRRRSRLRGRRGRDRARALRRPGGGDAGRLDRLQPRQRRAGDGLGRRRLRGVVHRAALADRAGAGGGADRRAEGAQPLARGIGRRHRRRPARVHLPPGEEIEASFVDGQGCLAQIPGANFYHRLREKFGRLSSMR